MHYIIQLNYDDLREMNIVFSKSKMRLKNIWSQNEWQKTKMYKK